jgi:amino acid transporter
VKGRTAIKWNALIASVVTFVLFTAALAAMYYAGGVPFINGALSNPTLVYNYSFNFWILAMGASGNQIIAAILGIGWIVWNIVTIAIIWIVVGRYLLAQSFDRFLPSAVSYVSPRFNTPVRAHLIHFVITIVLTGLAAYYYGTLSALFGVGVAALAYFGIVGISAVVHGLKKETGSIRIGMVISGILAAGAMFYLVSQFFLYAHIWGMNLLAGYFILAIVIFSIIMYTAEKMHLRAKGIDIGLAFKELPPE